MKLSSGLYVFFCALNFLLGVGFFVASCRMMFDGSIDYAGYYLAISVLNFLASHSWMHTIENSVKKGTF